MDGITCVLAVILMKIVLKQKEMKIVNKEGNSHNENNFASVFHDKPYWIFLAVVFLMGFIFLQLFTTMPLYYKDVHVLTEVQIGLIMALNGFLIFLLEMPLIHYIEKKIFNKMKIITWSLLMFALSFAVLNSTLWVGILIISMLLITVGEMLAFPFTNNFAMNRAPIGKEGRYLALYSMAFSFAHIFSAKTGMEVIDRFGFAANWYLMASLGLLAVVLMLWLRRALKTEKNSI